MNKKTLLKTIAIGIFTVITGIGFFIYSGFYDISATAPHFKPVEWLLRTTMIQSVRFHSREIVIPEDINLMDPDLAEKAIGHYAAACVVCHGAPGEGRAPWVISYPEAPLLTVASNVRRWKDTELFWITKNGIKASGMLALGPTHKASDIWAVTAFVKQLPTMKVDEYKAMLERLKLKGEVMGGKKIKDEKKNHSSHKH